MEAEAWGSGVKIGRLFDLLFRRTEVFEVERWAVEGVLHGKDTGGIATLLRLLLTPLAGLHQIGLEVYLLPYRIGIRKRYRLPVPVISIGNLSSGGTGKTPTTALVAGYLRREGKRVVILSRGHRGKGEQGSAPRVVSDGERLLLGPEEAGDEPTLLASLLPGVPVIVGRDRRKSGRLALERFAPEVIVLDDGLQFWQLERDLDIILLDARRPFDNGFVLPRGLLREPPSHLSRAGVVVMTRADRVRDSEALTNTIAGVRHRAQKGTPVLTATHAPIGWVAWDDPDTLLPVELLVGRAALVVSGIADGAAFAEMVRHLGVRVAAIRSFGDHHHYSEAEIRRLIAACGKDIALVTTEKDLVKIRALIREAAIPIYALRIALKVNEEQVLYQKLTEVTALSK